MLVYLWTGKELEAGGLHQRVGDEREARLPVTLRCLQLALHFPFTPSRPFPAENIAADQDSKRQMGRGGTVLDRKAKFTLPFKNCIFPALECKEYSYSSEQPFSPRYFGIHELALKDALPIPPPFFLFPIVSTHYFLPPPPQEGICGIPRSPEKNKFR
jgi:hypothetical protein